MNCGTNHMGEPELAQAAEHRPNMPTVIVGKDRRSMQRQRVTV